jgi:hypothetical protein
LNASSNYGADTFLAAPGTDIVTIVPGGGTTSTKGLSITSDYTIRIRLGGATLADPVVLDGVIRPKK